jgi:hypothetical protein
MNYLELITITLLIALLSGKEMIRAYGEDGPKKKRMRVLNIFIVPLLVAFCVIVIRTVVTAAGG